MKIRKPSVAGQFYSSSKEELVKKIEEFTENFKKEANYASRVIIVPHAGHEYSGALAVKGYQYLKKDLETLVIFSPAHRFAVKSFALSTDDAWEVPNGTVLTDKETIEQIKNMGGEYCDEAFINEHSIEVQLPFIKHYFPTAKIVPILVGGVDYKILSNIISEFWKDEKIGFIISSDLSHFRNKQEAMRIDNVTADMIEKSAPDNIMPEQACGYKAISAIVNFTREHNYSLIRVEINDSSETSGDTTSVVGYGSWYLAEEERIDFLKEHFSEIILQIAKLSIKSQLERLNLKIENYPKALETKIPCFVSLYREGNLRGCIGNIIGEEPFIVNLCKNARNAAFHDLRFTPVEAKEFEKLDMSVSLLSAPSRIIFEDEEDLLNQLRQDADGLIIKDIGRQAVFLPEVWKTIPDKKLFLNTLKQKAGLMPAWFSDTFEAYRFTTAIIK